jgi:hypothetical protein
MEYRGIVCSYKEGSGERIYITIEHRQSWCGISLSLLPQERFMDAHLQYFTMGMNV